MNNITGGRITERRLPCISITVLTLIAAGCLIGDFAAAGNPYYMELAGVSLPPGAGHLFGTDTLGRDLFSVIWCGGRISLTVGLLSTLISTSIAVVYGAAAGLASEKTDDIMMRLTEILMSVPQILLVMFLQAALGKATVISISAVIGITGWMAVAKIIRSEVKQLRTAGFVMAARSMGGGFFYILGKHLMPNFMSAVMFMVITNIGSAIGMEATLSFLGIGLPTDIISWGSLMSLSQRAMLTGAWWLLLIPGAFLVATLICITEISEYLRTRNRAERLM